MSFRLTSGSFQEGGTIPKKYTADGEDVSPALSWSDPPDGTRSFALVCDDPDAPKKTWVHWVSFNIPALTTELPEGFSPNGAETESVTQGKNDFGKLGYGGPSPPPGPPHRYIFRLYALDTMLELPTGAPRKDLTDAMQNHVLGETQLTGTYGR